MIIETIARSSNTALMRARDIFFESVGIRLALELCVNRAIAIPNGEISKGYQLLIIRARMMLPQIDTSKDMATNA